MGNYSSSFILDCTFWLCDRSFPMQILFATKAKAAGAIFFAPKAKRQVQFFLHRKQSDRCNFFCTESKATGAEFAFHGEALSLLELKLCGVSGQQDVGHKGVATGRGAFSLCSSMLLHPVGRLCLASKAKRQIYLHRKRSDRCRCTLSLHLQRTTSK